MSSLFFSRAAEKTKTQRDQADKYIRAFAKIDESDVNSGISVATRLASDLEVKDVRAEDIMDLNQRLKRLGDKVNTDDGPLKAYTLVFKTIKKAFDEAAPNRRPGVQCRCFRTSFISPSSTSEITCTRYEAGSRVRRSVTARDSPLADVVVSLGRASSESFGGGQVEVGGVVRRMITSDDE